MNPSFSRFSPHKAQLCLSYAISLTPQYGDAFFEVEIKRKEVNAQSIRLQMITSPLLLEFAACTNIPHLACLLQSLSFDRLINKCTFSDPNFGFSWFALKRTPLDSAEEVMMAAIRLVAVHVAVNATAYYAAMQELAARKLRERQQSRRLFHSVFRVNEWKQSMEKSMADGSKSEIVRFPEEIEGEEGVKNENAVRCGCRSARLGFAVKPLCFCLPGENLTMKKQLKVLFGTVQVEG